MILECPSRLFHLVPSAVLLTILKCMILLLLLPATLEAQWRNNGVPIVDTVANNSTFLLPQVVEDSEGGAIVCWRDARSGQSLDIYAQRIDSSGVVQWQTNGVPICTVPLNQNFPRMIRDGEGGAIIAWEDDRDTVDTIVYAQKVSHTGQPLWSVNGVRVSEKGGLFVRPVTDGQGGVIIAWWSYDTQLNHHQVFCQRLSIQGQVMWGDSGVLISSRLGQIPNNQIRITSDRCGGAVIGWIQDAKVYAQRVDSSGTVRWIQGGVVICTDSGGRGAVQVVTDVSNSFLVSWSDQRPAQGFYSGVYVQKIDLNGVPQWENNGRLVASDATSPLLLPNTSGVIVQFRNLTIPNPTTGARAQRLDLSGVRQWDSNGVVITAGPSINFNLVHDLFGGVVVLWEEDVGGNNLDILSQRIDSTGIVRWQSSGVQLVTDSSLQEFPGAASDARGGAIAVWDDQRSFIDPNTPDHVAVFAQRVSAQGIVTSIAEPRTDFSVPQVPILNQNYPNPFNPETTIEYTLPKSTHVQLSVFDVLGREVARLVNEEKPAGSYVVKLDASNFASGMYLYRLNANGFSQTKKMMLVH